MEVGTVVLDSGGKFSLTIVGSNLEIPPYDAVILAMPLTQDMSTLRFEQFPKRFHFPGRFHQTVCTMVQGDINYETFKFSDKDSVIDEIFSTNRTLFFNSIARNYPVDVDDGIEGTLPVWKVFSNELLSKEELNYLFSEINETHVINWKAYPEYDGSISSGNFTLYPGLFHVNVIEFAASAMEMGVIGAKNVALLVASHLGIDIQAHQTKNFHLEL